MASVFTVPFEPYRTKGVVRYLGIMLTRSDSADLHVHFIQWQDLGLSIAQLKRLNLSRFMRNSLRHKIPNRQVQILGSFGIYS